MCCLSLLKADPGKEEALPCLWQACLCQVSTRNPCLISGWPLPLCQGERKNGKSAKESKHHALKKVRRRRQYWSSHGINIAVRMQAHTNPGQSAWDRSGGLPFASSTGCCECLTHQLVLPLLSHPAALVVCSFLFACYMPNKPTHSKAFKSPGLLYSRLLH